MDKRFMAIIAIIVIAFTGVIVLNRQKASAPGGSNNVQATNHVKGANAKKINLTEYGDFQCPVCGAYEPIFREVYAKYQQDIQFQFRNFPLQTIHQNALAGSRAAEAAALQGKFWEMHDQLYDNQQTWTTATTPQIYFEQYAKALGLNMDQYKKDFASERINNIISADTAAGEKLKISGTPGIVINGKLYKNEDFSDGQNRPQVAKFSAILDGLIAAKSKK